MPSPTPTITPVITPSPTEQPWQETYTDPDEICPEQKRHVSSPDIPV